MIWRLYFAFSFLFQRMLHVFCRRDKTCLVSTRVNNQKYNNQCLSIEKLRKTLLNDNRIIPNINLGEGKNKKEKISVSEIARQASSSKKDRKILFSLVTQFKPIFILELGTSLGFSAAAMSIANSESNIATIEGNPYIATIARENFEKLEVKNIQLISDSFENGLSEALEKIEKPFLAFIDGNHSYDATLGYYHKLSEYAQAGSILVFHDIHWSKGMNEAWKEICKASKAQTSWESWNIGIVFFN